MQKVALITGITGQDGSYLADLLLSKGYLVHGIVRRSSQSNRGRLDHIRKDPHEGDAQLRLHYGDLADGSSLRRILSLSKPTEVYNLAAQSHVKVSFEQAEYTADIVATGTLRLLEALRDYQQQSGSDVRFYQAGSSEMFGSTNPPQSESAPFWPRSPYAAAKVAAFYYTINFREAYGMFCSNGLLFNHESPRRGEAFVTRKITRAAARIKLGLQKELFLGNLDSKRDWGFAGDYVEAMWMMLQHSRPDDFVVATGESYSVRDFLTETFSYLELDWEKFVKIDSNYFRPTEVDHLHGDASKARDVLGWKPRTSFKELVKMMVDHDLGAAEREKVLLSAGYVGR